MKDFKEHIRELMLGNQSIEMKINSLIDMVDHVRDTYYNEGYEDGMSDGIDEIFEECLINAQIY